MPTLPGWPTTASEAILSLVPLASSGALPGMPTERSSAATTKGVAGASLVLLRTTPIIAPKERLDVVGATVGRRGQPRLTRRRHPSSDPIGKSVTDPLLGPAVVPLVDK